MHTRWTASDALQRAGGVKLSPVRGVLRALKRAKSRVYSVLRIYIFVSKSADTGKIAPNRRRLVVITLFVRLIFRP